MKKLIIGIIAAALICSFTLPVNAATTQDLNITLSGYTEASILLNDTTWTPSAGLGTNESTGINHFKLDNDGSVQLDVDIKGSIEPTWSLGASAAHDVVYVAYNIGSGNVEITTGDLDFVNDLAHNESQNFGMYIDMPTTSSTSIQQNITVTFTATAD